MTEILVTFVIGMGGVALGGFITYMVQRQIQERALRNERAEKIYAPLLDQLDIVEAQLNYLKLDVSWPEWQGLREKHLIHFIAPGLKEKLWEFFVAELHNFNLAIEAAVNTVSVSVKEDILQKTKEKERGALLTTSPHYLGQDFLNQCAKRVLIEYIGFGGIDNPQLERNYSELEKKYFEKKIPFNDFIANLASKIKDHPFFKDGRFKGELEQLIAKTQELRREIKKEMKIKNKDEWG